MNCKKQMEQISNKISPKEKSIRGKSVTDKESKINLNCRENFQEYNEENKEINSEGEIVLQNGASLFHEETLNNQENNSFNSYLTNSIVSQATVDESHRLYKFHLRREFMLNDLLIPECILREAPPLHLGAIITLADEFRSSPQRRWVYEQAQAVNLESLNFYTFQDLLNGLFQQGGVTCERVLVLFFFCTDLAIRAFREKLINYFFYIQQWASNYISNNLSFWVENNGGWEEVLNRSMHPIRTFVLLSACCIGVLALILYVRKSKT